MPLEIAATHMQTNEMQQTETAPGYRVSDR